MTEETIEPTSSTEEQRAEAVMCLRMLAMGRLSYANRLAEIMVPDAPEVVALPVIGQSDEPKTKTAKAKSK